MEALCGFDCKSASDYGTESPIASNHRLGSIVDPNRAV